jgi:cell division protein FtsB
MAKNESRKPFWRKLVEFRLLFVVNAVVLAALGLSFGREWMRNSEIQSEIARLEEQARSLETRNLQIADLNTAFRTESFIEREARLKLGMKKPGENVVVIQEDGSTPGPIIDATDGMTAEAADPRLLLAVDGEPKELANPSKWWQYFFERK